MIHTIEIIKSEINNAFISSDYYEPEFNHILIDLSDDDLKTISKARTFLKENNNINCVEMYVSAEYLCHDDSADTVTEFTDSDFRADASLIKIFNKDAYYFYTIERHTNVMIEIGIDIAYLINEKDSQLT